MKEISKASMMALTPSLGIACLTSPLAVAAEGINYHRFFRSNNNNWKITK